MRGNAQARKSWRPWTALIFLLICSGLWSGCARLSVTATLPPVPGPSQENLSPEELAQAPRSVIDKYLGYGWQVQEAWSAMRQTGTCMAMPLVPEISAAEFEAMPKPVAQSIATKLTNFAWMVRAAWEKERKRVEGGP